MHGHVRMLPHGKAELNHEDGHGLGQYEYLRTQDTEMTAERQ